MQGPMSIDASFFSWSAAQTVAQEGAPRHVIVSEAGLQPHEAVRRASQGRVATVHNPYSFEGPQEVVLEDEIPSTCNEELPIFHPLPPPLQAVGPPNNAHQTFHYPTPPTLDTAFLPFAAAAAAAAVLPSNDHRSLATPSLRSTSIIDLSDSPRPTRQPPFLLSSVLLNVSSSWHCHGKRVSSASALRRLRAQVNQEAAHPLFLSEAAEGQTPRLTTSPTQKSVPFRERRVRQCLALLRKVPVEESEDAMSGP
eukprot:EG_transcript_18481